MPPLPNTLYTRDTTVLALRRGDAQPAVLAGPPRRDPAHEGDLRVPPRLRRTPAVWWGDPEEDWGLATFEGGDVMPIGNATVVVGMSERTSRQAITQVAQALFGHGAAERVIVAGMPKLRAAMHLDTVFTFADRDVATAYLPIVDSIETFTIRPTDARHRCRRHHRDRSRSSTWSRALSGSTELRVDRDRRRRLRNRTPTVGQRQQPRRHGTGGRRHLRPQHDDELGAAQGRRRGHHHRRRGARPRPRRRPLHDLSAHPGPDRNSVPSAHRRSSGAVPANTRRDTVPRRIL